MASEPTLSSLAILALTSQSTTDADLSSGAQEKTKEQVRRHYVRTLHKVIDQSDIVILVLDARDPEGCRSRLVEEEVRRRESEGKKLVFVLNKIGALFYSLPNTAMLTLLLFFGPVCRPGTSRKRPALASTSASLNPNPPIPLCLFYSTHTPLLNNGARSSPSPESLQTKCSTERDSRRCRLSECRQEQFDQFVEESQSML
jgi:hypothetical protein